MMIPPELFPQCDQLVRKDADGMACEGFIAGLPEPGQGLLRLLLALLQQIDADATRMTADNLSRVFMPTVIKREDPLEMANHVKSDIAFVSHLIQRLPVLEGGTRSSTLSPNSRGHDSGRQNGTALPLGWESVTSRSTGLMYYHNLSTGETTYDLPDKPAMTAEEWRNYLDEAVAR